MRASRAEDWRTRRDVRVYRVAAGLFRLGEECAAHALRRQLVYPRKFLASRTGDAEGFDEVFKVGLVLLDDVERLDGGGEVADFLLRQRPCKAELEVGGLVAEDFLRVVVGNSARDDADLAGAALDAVERRRFAVFLERRDALGQYLLAALRVRGGHDVFRHVLLVGTHLALGSLAGLDERLAVADARRYAEEHRRVELFGNLEGFLDVVEALLAVGGLDHRNLRVRGVEAVVLLVLRAEKARVVRGHYHEAAVDARVGEREERVGRDVEADVLHRGERARTRYRSAGRGLERDLFVSRPLGIDPGVLVRREVFENLRRGRSGIRGGEVQPGFPRASGRRLVSGHYLPH